MYSASELPPNTVTYDESGKIKTTITWRYKDPILKNEAIKTTVVTRVIKKYTRKVSKGAIRRRNMIFNKFGACKGNPPGIEKGVTSFQSKNEPIVFEPFVERSPQIEIKEEKEEKRGMYIPPALRKQGNSRKQVKTEPVKTNLYIPPAIRNKHVESQQYLKEITIRIANLPEETKDVDLNELVKSLNPTKVKLIKDRRTGLSRGFGFVTFTCHKDAENAMRVLNGYKYGYLVLECSLAK